MPFPTSREKFSSKGISWFVIPLIQRHVDTFGPFWCFTRVSQFGCDYMFLFKIYPGAIGLQHSSRFIAKMDKKDAKNRSVKMHSSFLYPGAIGLRHSSRCHSLRFVVKIDKKRCKKAKFDKKDAKKPKSIKKTQEIAQSKCNHLYSTLEL